MHAIKICNLNKVLEQTKCFEIKLSSIYKFWNKIPLLAEEVQSAKLTAYLTSLFEDPKNLTIAIWHITINYIAINYANYNIKWVKNSKMT